jgi:hypothetical protein
LEFRAFCERIGRQGSSAMRSLCAFLSALLFIVALGCTTDGPRAKNWFSSLPAFRGPTGSDVVQLEWGLIERPVGDRYLNEDLWSLANEQVVPLEHKDLFESNGLRIAQLGGLLPSEFLEMVRSERSNPAPQRQQVRAGRPTLLALGPVREECDCTRPALINAMRVYPDFMFHAQFGITVTAALTDDNKVRLSFTPQVQHGIAKATIKAADDGSGWTSSSQPTIDKYGELSWDATLASTEYLIIGGRLESSHCFGEEAFVRIDEPRPVQRLLVIRAARQVMTPAGAETAEENMPPRTTAAIAQGSLR